MLRKKKPEEQQSEEKNANRGAIPVSQAEGRFSIRKAPSRRCCP